MEKTTERTIMEKVNKEETKGKAEYIEKYFSIVRASTLSLEDEFLKHEPESRKQREFKKLVIKAIKSGLSDFRAQRMDATLDENDRICYQIGKKPAVGKSSNWWKRNAKEFMPEKNSRLGKRNERIAFLALLVKYLIQEQGYTVSDAWKAVCDQSKDLGHYWDSKNAKHEFEPTGSRKIGEWYDLANTYKITVKDETGVFLFVGGVYIGYGSCYPLAGVYTDDNPCRDRDSSVGWIVIDV